MLQFFGEHHELYSKSVCYPAPINQCLQAHSGWDIVRAPGTPIFCVEGGKVVDVQTSDTGYGKSVRILTQTSEWIYGHFSEISVVQGQSIDAGDPVGKMGNSGFTVYGYTPYWPFNPYNGTHLHLERKAVIPYTNQPSWSLYPTGDKAVLLNADNGYFGAVSFDSTDFVLQGPFFEDFGFGSSSFRVKLWQQILVQEGFANWQPTSFFGLKTLAATKAVQSKRGIPSTGYVGPLTRAWANATYLTFPTMPTITLSSTTPPAPPPAPAPAATSTPVTSPTLLWGTPADAEHSVRVICDQEGLTVEQKNTMDATIHAESGYDTHVTHENYAIGILTGKKYLASTDYGICQWNDKYHGKEISPGDAINNPEKAVRLMCQYWKRGQRDIWVAYSSGRYKQYLSA